MSKVQLLTDGEKCYGKFLFELCSEIIKTGSPGRPKKTLPPGVKVRLKNKGSQSHKRGSKKKKYEEPQPEHPATTQIFNQVKFMLIILKPHMQVCGEEILHIVARLIHMQKKVCTTKNFRFILGRS